MVIFQRPLIAAIIVTYHPDLDLLGKQVAQLASQVTDIVLVDNGSACDLLGWNSQREQKVTDVITLGVNLGIATAHNVGIKWARERGVEFVLLMDQDSLPAIDMVEKLVSAISGLTLPAAVGPRYLDVRQNNPPPFVRIRGLKLERCACAAEDSVVPVDYLISSGCLIPLSVFAKVGTMREDLFIDYVDIEWGLRARQHGLQSYGVCSAHMQHSLGERPIKFFGKNIPLHSPIRHYYHFRNAVLLYKEIWLPLNWKLVDCWRLCLKYGFYTLFAKPRMAHWQMMTLGIWHGLIGRTGKLKSN